MKSIDDEFLHLCYTAMNAFNEENEDISFESTLKEILEFVKRNPNHRDQFVELFKRVLVSGDSPVEAVAFCMRELRWPEIREYVEKIMNESEDPRSEVHRTIITAYDEDWPDEDLYEYYSGSSN